MIELTKKMMISAAHFVHKQGGKCTHLHGHNWNITVKVRGEIQDDGMVVDFGQIKRIVMEMDHKVIIPDNLMESGYETESNSVIEFPYELLTKKYSLPKEDIYVFSQPSVTSEYMVKEIYKGLKMRVSKEFKYQITVEETPGSKCTGGDW